MARRRYKKLRGVWIPNWDPSFDLNNPTSGGKFGGQYDLELVLVDNGSYAALQPSENPGPVYVRRVIGCIDITIAPVV